MESQPMGWLSLVYIRLNIENVQFFWSFDGNVWIFLLFLQRIKNPPTLIVAGVRELGYVL